MRTLIIHIALFLIGTIHSTVFAQGAPDPNCPLAYFYAGYDYVKGNPAANDMDPGWRADIMSKQRNETCLYCRSATACSAKYDAFEMEGEIDYYNRLYYRASLSANSENFLVSTAFTGSGEFEYQRQDVFGLGLVNIQAEGSCQLFEGGRYDNCYDVNFVPPFLGALEEFPISTDEPGWFEEVRAFFNTFGTHMISTTSLGARWAYESQFTEVSYEALRAADVNIQLAAEASAEFFRTKEASGEFESEEQTELRLLFDGSAERQRAIYVGATPSSDINFGDWANNIDMPVPQTYSLAPISELLTLKMFPDDPNIELKRQVMEAGYERYCDSVPGCGVPQPPKIVRVSERQEGIFQTQNEATVVCPANYQLISGGCKTDPLPSEPYYWIMSSLKPVENTYSCIANMDYALDLLNHNYYKGLNLNATCLHKDYIKDVVIEPCEGPIGQQGSECVAYCPTGYEVTGGGCESNFPDESRPWKVTTSSPHYTNSSDREGWNCRVGEDYQSSTYNRKALGYAICIQYLPNKVIDHKIVTENSGTAGKWTNGAVASCDVGYQIVGGGCRTPSHGSNTLLEWKVVETQPARNQHGWSCLAQEDIQSLTYNQNVQTDAVCVLFK